MVGQLSIDWRIVFADFVINNVHGTYFDFHSRQSQSHTYDLSSKTSQIFKKLYGFEIK